MTRNPGTRRDVLRALLHAPALAGLTPALRAFAGEDPLIDSPAKALDIFDFERLARAKLPPAHFGYLATGVDGDATLHANDAGFANYALRVRRLGRTDDQRLTGLQTASEFQFRERCFVQQRAQQELLLFDRVPVAGQSVAELRRDARAAGRVRRMAALGRHRARHAAWSSAAVDRDPGVDRAGADGGGRRPGAVGAVTR